MKALTLTSLWKLDFNSVESVDGGFFLKLEITLLDFLLPSSGGYFGKVKQGVLEGNVAWRQFFVR